MPVVAPLFIVQKTTDAGGLGASAGNLQQRAGMGEGGVRELGKI